MSFTAPEVDADTSANFKVTVTDNDGATGSDTISITILDTTTQPVNQLPTVNISGPASADESSSVTFTASATDSDGEITSYLWTQIDGPSVSILNSTSDSMSFIAPEVDVDTTANFKVTVTDNDGATGSDTISITILDTTTLPVEDVALLTVASFNILDNAVIDAGHIGEMTLNVTNMGTAIFNDYFDVDFYLSNDGVQDDLDRFISGGFWSINLAPEGSKELIKEFVIPSNMGIDGTVYIIADVYYKDSERTRRDVGEFPLPIHLTHPNGDVLPDLTIEQVNWGFNVGDSLAIGQMIYPEVFIKNQGTSAAPSSCIELFLSLDMLLGSEDTSFRLCWLTGTYLIEQSDMSDDHWFPYDFNIPAVPPGGYYIIATVDSDNIVPESNEDNNIAAIAVQITKDENIDDNFEPNDTSQTSTPMPKGTFFNGTAVANNPDWFEILIEAESQLVTIEYTMSNYMGSGTPDSSLVLIDSANNPLAYIDNSDFNVVKTGSALLKPGTYYLLIENQDWAPSSFDYSINWTSAPAPTDDTHEEDDTAEEALKKTDLALGALATGISWDLDLYPVTLPAGVSNITVNLTHNAGLGELAAVLLVDDPSFGLIPASEYGDYMTDGSQPANITGLVAGTQYFLAIVPATSFSGANYTVYWNELVDGALMLKSLPHNIKETTNFSSAYNFTKKQYQANIDAEGMIYFKK